MRESRFFSVWTLLLMTLALAIAEKNQSTFVPTKEWQRVGKGIPIPKGLHVRHNLQTGVTEAKLLDENDAQDESVEKSEKSSLAIHPDKSLNEDIAADMERHAAPLKVPIKVLQDMLQKIKSDEPELKREIQNSDILKEIRKKFKTYAELKEELEDLNVKVSTDSELMKGFFKKFEGHKDAIVNRNLETSVLDEILDVLNNLEYLIHQIDNAQIFTNMGGMSKIISPCLNSTNSEVKSEALRLLGAAVQSNPKVQMKALDSDYVQKILHMITLNDKSVVKSRCLFALSALVRNFPAAQKVFIDHGGLEIFGKILDGGQLQIQIRVMNIIYDLVAERQHYPDIEDENQRLHKIKKYASTNFEDKLSSQKYCKYLGNLLVKSSKGVIMEDFLQILYKNIIAVSSICKNDFIENRRELLPAIYELTAHQRFVEKETSENLSKLVKVMKESVESHEEL